MPAWIPVVVVVAAVLLYFVVRLFNRKGNNRGEIVDKAKADARAIKTAADAQLAVELQDVDADKAELAEIGELEDDEARLSALADYANRRRR